MTELRVRDLGVIEDLSLTFGDGMTVLTGETGAGKTLVVEALHLVLGGRASPTMVRAAAISCASCLIRAAGTPVIAEAHAGSLTMPSASPRR